MVLAVTLSVLIGLSLGLLGGGGSILTVPILVYALGVEPRSAIATSLLVVGITSGVAALARARRGDVKGRVGLVFGLAGMAGAFVGGRLGHHIPAGVLLLGFAAMMVATAVAMMRGRRAKVADESAGAGASTKLPAARVALQGGGVGLVAGLVGAGGGFLVVPALALLGGLEMSAAVGTSLMVIAMQSLAGFAGHLGHTPIDWHLAAVVSAAAVAGSLAGNKLSRYVSQAALRKGFAWFVLVMAVYIVGRQLPPAVRDSALFHAALVARWPWYVGGAALAALVLGMLWLDNKLLGVSTGCAELCTLHRDKSARSSWRVVFLVGIVLGGLASALLGGAHPTFALGAFDTIFSAGAAVKVPVLLGAGLLIGFGARTAGGCTSGHSIVGVAQGARSSLVATGAFMAAGFAVTQLIARIHA